MARTVRRVAPALALLLVLATSLPPARSAQPAPEFGAPREGLEVRLGAGLLTTPAYAGSRVTVALPLPYLSGGYGTRFDFDILDGATYSVIEAGGFSAGFAARWQLGRSFHDSKARLRGLRHISRSFEIGGFAAYEAGPLALQATLTQDVTRSHHGAELEIRALAQGAIGHVAVSAGPHLIAVTQPFAQAFYGVSAEEARASGLPAYRPGGGIERIGLMGAGEWRLTDRTSLIGVFDYSRLMGDIGRSPLASAPGGTRHQLDVGVFLTYRLF